MITKPLSSVPELFSEFWCRPFIGDEVTMEDVLEAAGPIGNFSEIGVNLDVPFEWMEPEPLNPEWLLFNVRSETWGESENFNLVTNKNNMAKLMEIEFDQKLGWIHKILKCGNLPARQMEVLFRGGVAEAVA